MADGEALVSQSDIAGMAGVTSAAVSNWRRRYHDFPNPVQETGTGALFSAGGRASLDEQER